MEVELPQGPFSSLTGLRPFPPISLTWGQMLAWPLEGLQALLGQFVGVR